MVMRSTNGRPNHLGAVAHALCVTSPTKARRAFNLHVRVQNDLVRVFYFNGACGGQGISTAIVSIISPSRYDGLYHIAQARYPNRRRSRVCHGYGDDLLFLCSLDHVLTADGNLFPYLRLDGRDNRDLRLGGFDNYDLFLAGHDNHDLCLVDRDNCGVPGRNHSYCSITVLSGSFWKYNSPLLPPSTV